MTTEEVGASTLAVPAGFLADVLVLLHFGFVLFVAAGALLVLRWPRLASGTFPQPSGGHGSSSPAGSVR